MLNNVKVKQSQCVCPRKPNSSLTLSPRDRHVHPQAAAEGRPPALHVSGDAVLDALVRDAVDARVQHGLRQGLCA